MMVAFDNSRVERKINLVTCFIFIVLLIIFGFTLSTAATTTAASKLNQQQSTSGANQLQAPIWNYVSPLPVDEVKSAAAKHLLGYFSEFNIETSSSSKSEHLQRRRTTLKKKNESKEGTKEQNHPHLKTSQAGELRKGRGKIRRNRMAKSNVKKSKKALGSVSSDKKQQQISNVVRNKNVKTTSNQKSSRLMKKRRRQRQQKEANKLKLLPNKTTRAATATDDGVKGGGKAGGSKRPFYSKAAPDSPDSTESSKEEENNVGSSVDYSNTDNTNGTTTTNTNTIPNQTVDSIDENEEEEKNGGGDDDDDESTTTLNAGDEAIDRTPEPKRVGAGDVDEVDGDTVMVEPKYDGIDDDPNPEDYPEFNSDNDSEGKGEGRVEGGKRPFESKDAADSPDVKESSEEEENNISSNGDSNSSTDNTNGTTTTTTSTIQDQTVDSIDENEEEEKKEKTGDDEDVTTMTLNAGEDAISTPAPKRVGAGAVDEEDGNTGMVEQEKDNYPELNSDNEDGEGFREDAQHARTPTTNNDNNIQRPNGKEANEHDDTKKSRPNDDHHYCDDGSYKHDDHHHHHKSHQDAIKWLEESVPGEPGKDYPIFDTKSAVNYSTKFNCRDQKYPGYYADVASRCQIFHVCQADGRQDSFLCPNGTIFSQISTVCVWWNSFDCDEATVAAAAKLNHQQSTSGANQVQAPSSNYVSPLPAGEVKSAAAKQLLGYFSESNIEALGSKERTRRASVKQAPPKLKSKRISRRRKLRHGVKPRRRA